MWLKESRWIESVVGDKVRKVVSGITQGIEGTVMN